MRWHTEIVPVAFVAKDCWGQRVYLFVLKVVRRKNKLVK